MLALLALCPRQYGISWHLNVEVAISIQPNHRFCVGVYVGSYVALGGLNKLTALKVKKANAQGRFPDGNCPYLVVGTSGAKHWLLRIVALGMYRDMGLGSASLVDSGAPWSTTSGKLNWPVKG
jgi:hypothetical protein